MESEIKKISQSVKEKKEHDIVITRVFDAPRELVWRAYIEPERIMKWYGPIDFTAPVIKIDFRVGGIYHFCMRGPDGKDYWSTGVFRKIVPMEKIISTDSFADEKGNIVLASHYGMTGDWPLELLVTVTFEDYEGKTKFSIHHSGFPTYDDSEMAKQGWSTMLDKLADYLTNA